MKQATPYGVQQQAVEPFAVYPAEQQQMPLVNQPTHRPIPVPGRPIPTVVFDPNGMPYYGHPPIQYPPPREPDRWPARLAGAGVFAAGVGYGGAQILNAAAGATGALVAATALVVALKWKGSGGGGGGRQAPINVHTDVNVQVDTSKGWFRR